MDEHFQRIIAEAQQKLVAIEKEASEIKDYINRTCKFAGAAPMYADVGTSSNEGNIFAIRSDQFHGRGMATVVREYLEMRKRSNLGAATVDDIFDALVKGGYEFDPKDNFAKRGMAISIAKNTAQFYKLPNGTFGLIEWYPNIKKSKAEKSDSKVETVVSNSAPEEGADKKQ